MLDVHSSIYIWIGREANEEERRLSKETAEAYRDEQGYSSDMVRPAPNPNANPNPKLCGSALSTIVLRCGFHPLRTIVRRCGFPLRAIMRRCGFLPTAYCHACCANTPQLTARCVINTPLLTRVGSPSSRCNLATSPYSSRVTSMHGTARALQTVSSTRSSRGASRWPMRALRRQSRNGRVCDCDLPHAPLTAVRCALRKCDALFHPPLMS